MVDINSAPCSCLLLPQFLFIGSGTHLQPASVTGVVAFHKHFGGNVIVSQFPLLHTKRVIAFANTLIKTSHAISHMEINISYVNCFNSVCEMKISYVKLIFVCEYSISYVKYMFVHQDFTCEILNQFTSHVN